MRDELTLPGLDPAPALKALVSSLPLMPSCFVLSDMYGDSEKKPYLVAIQTMPITELKLLDRRTFTRMSLNWSSRSRN